MPEPDIESASTNDSSMAKEDDANDQSLSFREQNEDNQPMIRKQSNLSMNTVFRFHENGFDSVSQNGEVPDGSAIDNNSRKTGCSSNTNDICEDGSTSGQNPKRGVFKYVLRITNQNREDPTAAESQQDDSRQDNDSRTDNSDNYYKSEQNMAKEDKSRSKYVYKESNKSSIDLSNSLCHRYHAIQLPVMTQNAVIGLRRSETGLFRVNVLQSLSGLGIVLTRSSDGVQISDIQKTGPVGRNGSIR